MATDLDKAQLITKLNAELEILRRYELMMPKSKFILITSCCVLLILAGCGELYFTNTNSLRFLSGLMAVCGVLSLNSLIMNHRFNKKLRLLFEAIQGLR